MRSIITSSALLALAAFSLFNLTSCSSGPQPPQPGTPPYYWAAANATFKNGDFAKASENLQNLIKTDNEFRARAYPWALIMSAGMAQGYMEYADHQETGARANRNNPGTFRKEASVARNAASTMTLQFVETYHKFRNDMKEGDLPLAFEFPSGTLAEPPALEKIEKGMTLQQSELDALQSALVKRGVIQVLCQFVGTPKDSAKALELFKKGEVKANRDVMTMAIANLLYDQSELYSSKKLDQPQRIKILSTEALEGLGSLKDNKQAKDLATKIQANLKKLKLT